MDETITSRKNPLITRMAKLSDKKHRDAEGLFRIDGVKLFSEAVSVGLSVEYVFLSDAKREKLMHELAEPLASCGARIVPVTEEVLAKLTEEQAPQGIVAVVRKFPALPPEIPAGEFRALWLSGIRDPGNVGTMIRAANAFGVDRVYLSADCADIYSPKVLRAAMGCAFRQPISIIRDELTFAREMQDAGCAFYTAALNRNARRLGSFTLPDRVCFAVGNEGHGLDDALIEASTGAVFIPMAPGCESLNAASAATVLLWEMCRVRLTR